MLVSAGGVGAIGCFFVVSVAGDAFWEVELAGVLLE